MISSWYAACVRQKAQLYTLRSRDGEGRTRGGRRRGLFLLVSLVRTRAVVIFVPGGSGAHLSPASFFPVSGELIARGCERVKRTRDAASSSGGSATPSTARDRRSDARGNAKARRRGEKPREQSDASDSTRRIATRPVKRPSGAPTNLLSRPRRSPRIDQKPSSCRESGVRGFPSGSLSSAHSTPSREHDDGLSALFRDRHPRRRR